MSTVVFFAALTSFSHFRGLFLFNCFPINIGAPQHFISGSCCVCFVGTLWAILFMLTVSPASCDLGDAQVFIALTFLLKFRSVCPGVYWTSLFHLTTGSLILSLLNIERLFPCRSPKISFLYKIHNLTSYSYFNKQL